MRYKALCSSIPIDPVLTDKPTAQLKSLYKRINDRWNKAMVPNGAQQ